MGCSPIKPNNDIKANVSEEKKENNSGLVIKQLKDNHDEDNNNEFLENFDEYDLLLGNEINSLSIKTEIFFSCRNLPKLTSGLNSFIRVFRNEGESWLKIGQTEIAKYTINPYYIKSFLMNYHFEEDENSQQLKIEINYIEGEEITKIDEVIVTLKDILTSRNQQLEKSLEDKKAKLVIKGVQKQTSSKYVNFKLGLKGKKMTKQKIYCTILKQGNHNEFYPIYLTEEKDHITTKKEKFFFWDNVDFPYDKIDSKGVFGKNEDGNVLKFQILEIKKNKPKLLTEVDIMSEELKIKREFRLKQYKNEYHFLIIEDYKVVDKFSLFSFLVSGMEYQTFFMLDLTRSKYNLEISNNLGNKFTEDFYSNEKKKVNTELIYRPINDLKCIDKDKFAYLNVVKENILKKNEEEALEINQAMADFFAYNRRYKEKRRQNVKKKITSNITTNDIQEMITLVNSLVKDQFSLDSDSRCPLLGYGCNIPPDYDIICNCFSLNQDILKSEVTNGKGIMGGYNNAMGHFYLSGPGLVSDTLELFLNYVKAHEFNEKKQKYNIAFYIVTSDIHDTSTLFSKLKENYKEAFTVVIASIGMEFNASGFQEEVEKYKAECGSEEKRVNMIYINYHEIFSKNGTKFPEKLKYTCKWLYNRINEQFVDYINIVNVKPFDFENIKNKNTPNFIDFRKKKMSQKHNVSPFLIDEKNKLIQDIKELKYSMSLMDEIFGEHLPTFDRHYIISQLNKAKSKQIPIEDNKQIKHNLIPKQFIRFKDQLMIDERDLVHYKKDDKIHYMTKFDYSLAFK